MFEFRTKIPAFYRRLWLAVPLFRSYAPINVNPVGGGSAGKGRGFDA